jgi:ATP-dependent exoDNAse (exonuclease V) beta subunit
VELDQDGVLDRVVDRVVANVMEDEFLHRWLVDYAIEQIQNGKSWDIRRNIKELGKQIFQEDFKKYAIEIKNFLKEEKNIKELQGFTRERREEIIRISRQLKEEANRIRIANGLDWTDFSGGGNSFAQKFDKLGERLAPVPELTEKQASLQESEEGWFAKTSKNKDAIISAYHQGLGNILSQFEPLLIKWNSLEAISKNIFVFGIFRNLLEELRLLKDEENILLISDANEFLKEITRENDAPFIYEKVGNQYQHYLIDEFQDTSGFQWASFKPLLENSLAHGQTNLLVGDVKQSIYRWRGGEMRLLLDEVERQIGENYIQTEKLGINFRSLPNIVAFNNALFKKLPQAFEQAVSQAYLAQDAGIISKAYEDVSQKVSVRKATLPFQGKVKIEFLEELKEEDEGKFTEQVLSRLPQMVMTLQDKGYDLKDIAFLVRTKKEGESIADTLMAFHAANPDLPYGFDVLSDESMYLHKSATVKALVAGLKYLHRPDEKVQFKTMWYYRAVLKNENIDHQLFYVGQIPEHLKEKVKAFEEKENAFLQLPLMEMVEELIAELGLQEEGLEKAYISGFKEAIYDFTTNNRADLAGFLEWWDENKTKRTVKIPEGHNAIRILTIHKSKGLQFKVVLMPFLRWTIFDTNKGNVVWSPFGDREKQFSAIIPLSLNSKLAKSDFNSTYAEEAVMAYLDSLNMIYVALTRAEEVFWGVVPYKQEIKNMNYLEAHLQLLLSSTADTMGDLSLSDYFDAEHRVFELGEWPDYPQVRSKEGKVTQLRWGYQNWTNLLQVKKYAVDFSPEGIEQRKKRDFGLLVHEILEKAESLAEARLQLKNLYFEGRITEEVSVLVERQMEKLFHQSQFASWFDPEDTLLTEQGILLPGGKQKRPDKIIFRENEAIVVDFKTGEEYSKYEKQVREYMALVQALSRKPTKGYICYLESGKIVEIFPN